MNPRYREMQERVERVLGKTLFFVVGCQKSGTTWVQHLLDGHPQIACKGEARFGPILIPACQRVLAHHNENQRVGPDGGFEDDHLRHLMVTSIAMLLSRWDGDGITCIGEKTPEHATYMAILNELFPDCRCVHITRDGRDGAVSGWFHNLREGDGTFKQRFPDLCSYVRQYVEGHWVPYIQTARAFGAQHPDRYFELRYEDLHADSAPVVSRLLAFLGVDASEASVSACVEAGSFKRVSGGRKRGEEDRGSFFRKGVIGDWKNHFDDDCLATYERFGGTLAAELGYV